MRVSLRAMLAIATAAIPLTLAGSFADGAAAAARSAPATAAVSADPAVTAYSAPGELDAVAAASASSAWAVGSEGSGGGGGDKILMLHWSGTAWSRVTSLKALTSVGRLSAITVVNAKDAWAVGYTGTGDSPRSLLLRWNGKAWSAVTSPAPVTFGTNSSVAFDGVATTSAGVTFASGVYTSQFTGVLARWTRKTWAWAGPFAESGTYHVLDAIAAASHGTAFAVGYNSTGTGADVISIEWTGKTWVKAAAPDNASLNAVTYVPGGAPWAAGSYPVKFDEYPVILHWTGKAWAKVTSPATVADLNGLGFAGANYGWAVGETAPGTAASKTFIEHWNGKTWS